MKNLEIERKFLVNKKLLNYLNKTAISIQKKSLKQYYTKINSQATKRFRKSDKHYFYTQKKGRGHKRREVEKEISKEEFKAHFPAIKGYLVKKKRYEFTLNDIFYEFDIFDAPVDDLALLECEFKSEKAYQSYKIDLILKPYIIKDVSDSFIYTNAAIALFKVPKEEVIDIKNMAKIKSHYQSGEVIRALLYRYLQNIMIHRKKILKTYADEELHQLRINIRKSRAIISKMGNVFEKEHLDYHDRHLSLFARATNKKRDLDVFVCALNEHFSRDLHDELRYFYSDIATQKKEEEKNVKLFLKSEELTLYLQELNHFLVDGKYMDKMAQEPIALFLEESIASMLKQIQKKIKQYEQDKKEEHLHKVRISFKKFRYILESFDRLFWTKNIKDLLKRVKNLQNDLGIFNDFCVQLAFLENYLKSHQLQRENEPSFDTFLTKVEKEKSKTQEKIEQDLQKAMDMKALKEDLQVKFT